MRFMSEILRNIWVGLTEASPLDQANLLLGIAGVWLMIRRSLWAFPVGLVAVTVQGVLFWQTKFYADAAVQGFFFAALAHGWWHWTHARGQSTELPVTRLPARGRVLVLLFAGAGTAAWALIAMRHTDTAMPWRDAFIAAFSVAGQTLQARKKIENWSVWIAVNLVAIMSYWQAELAYTAFLYTVYLALSFVGWREWHRAMKQPDAAHA
jgi:nicotinamide mononucleotide transporter